MKKDGLEFEQLENNEFRISTSQKLDADTFLKRIAGVAAQRENFNQQKEYFQNAILKNEESIKLADKNIEYANEDLEEAFTFLKKNHRQDLIVKLENMIEENKKKLEQNQQVNQENMGA